MSDAITFTIDGIQVTGKANVTGVKGGRVRTEFVTVYQNNEKVITLANAEMELDELGKAKPEKSPGPDGKDLHFFSGLSLTKSPHLDKFQPRLFFE